MSRHINYILYCSIVLLLVVSYCKVCTERPPYEPFDLNSKKESRNPGKRDSRVGWTSDVLFKLLNDLFTCISRPSSPVCSRFSVKVLCHIRHELMQPNTCPALFKPFCAQIRETLDNALGHDTECRKFGAYSSKTCPDKGGSCRKSEEEILVQNIFQTFRAQKLIPSNDIFKAFADPAKILDSIFTALEHEDLYSDDEF
jgi:hypothetical protein